MIDAAPSWHRPERRFWRSGPWRLEVRGDELADIAFDGRTVLRSIRAVVRDADWNTADWAVALEDGPDALMLRLDSRGDLDCHLTATLMVRASRASLAISFDGLAASAFETNRTGLVVLHPPQLAGQLLAITHPDGTEEPSTYPEGISPHQPAFDIAKLDWETAGLRVAVSFSGEVFEMEDQRNWTDASFKTYSRPLALPFPYRLEAGEQVLQEIVVTVDGSATTSGTDAALRTSEVVLDMIPGGVFPAIGSGASTAPDPAPPLSPIGSVLLVELDLASPTWRAALSRAAASGLPLDVRFVLDPDDPDALRVGVAALVGKAVTRVAAFPATGPAAHVTDAATTARLREALAAGALSLPVVGGARSHFTELNREISRVPAELDGIVFSTSPLFHSLDTEQLVESVAIQRQVARQAVRLAAGRPVHVGPVTLRPRFNNVATAAPSYPSATDLSVGYGPALRETTDPRQAAAELGAWTIASAAALAVPGVQTLVFFEDWGPRGIRDAHGEDLPVATAVRSLAELTGSALVTGDSPDGLVWALGGMSDEGTVVLVANLDAVSRTVGVREVSGRSALVTLEAGTWSRVFLSS